MHCIQPTHRAVPYLTVDTARYSFKYLGGSYLYESSLGGHLLGDPDGRRTVGLFHPLRYLLEHDLNVRRLGGVLSDATVSPVGSTATICWV